MGASGEAAGVCATSDAVEGLPDLEALTQSGLVLTDAETLDEGVPCSALG